MYCPKCDYQNPDDAVYCCACGTKMHWIGYTIHCPHCGWENNRKRATYCTKCSKPLPTLKNDIASFDDGAPVVHCLYCRAKYRGDFSFCYDCGHELRGESIESIEQHARADELLSKAAQVSTQIVEAIPKVFRPGIAPAWVDPRKGRPPPGYIPCPHCGEFVPLPMKPTTPETIEVIRYHYPRLLWLRVAVIFYVLMFAMCIGWLLLLAVLTTPAG